MACARKELMRKLPKRERASLRLDANERQARTRWHVMALASPIVIVAGIIANQHDLRVSDPGTLPLAAIPALGVAMFCFSQMLRYRLERALVVRAWEDQASIPRGVSPEWRTRFHAWAICFGFFALTTLLWATRTDCCMASHAYSAALTWTGSASGLLLAAICEYAAFLQPATDLRGGSEGRSAGIDQGLTDG